jgi:hypothetical protein
MPVIVAEGFSFSVELTPEDYRHLFVLMEQRQAQRTRIKYIYLFIALGAVPIALVLGILSRVMTPENNGWEVGALCALAFLIGMQAMLEAFRVVHARALRQSTSDAARTMNQASIRLDADGVKTGNDLNWTEWRWRAVSAVSVEDGSLMLWIGSQYGLRIPERAFGSVDEREAVLSYARSHAASV